MFATPQDVINRARSLAYVSSSQYTDTIALEDYNLYRKKIANEIMQKVNEGFFTSSITTPTIIWQNRYSLEDTVNWIKINKIDGVFVNWKKAIKIDGENMSEEEKEKQAFPSFYIKNNYLYLYPTPSEIGELRMEAAITPWELALTDTDTDMPEEARELIALAMIVDVYKRRGLLNEASFAFSSYQNLLSEVIGILTDRVGVPETVTMPNLDFYN